MVTIPLCYRKLDEELDYFRCYSFMISREEQMENVMMEEEYHETMWNLRREFGKISTFDFRKVANDTHSVQQKFNATHSWFSYAYSTQLKHRQAMI